MTRTVCFLCEREIDRRGPRTKPFCTPNKTLLSGVLSVGSPTFPDVTIVSELPCARCQTELRRELDRSSWKVTVGAQFHRPEQQGNVTDSRP
jgi:hypothetical protein